MLVHVKHALPGGDTIEKPVRRNKKWKRYKSGRSGQGIVGFPANNKFIGKRAIQSINFACVQDSKILFNGYRRYFYLWGGL